MKQDKTRVVIMRAGTSKGIFINEEVLPKDDAERTSRILRIFGSPDIRQIDGLGGAEPLTSKMAIIGKSTREDADVNYTFGQVSYVAPTIDYSGNCGNISAGVGPYAVDEGLVEVTEPYTTVRVHNTNTGKILVETVKVEDGIAVVDGDYAIAGVPGTGQKIEIDFSDTAGSKTGKLLPTGNPVDKMTISEIGEIEFSLVDAANPVIFVRAKDLGLTGIETPSQIDKDERILGILEEIRGNAAIIIGAAKDLDDALKNAPAFPMVAFVSESQDYTAFGSNKKIGEDATDFVSRLMFMQVIHKTYAGTGTICTGAAARIEGTLVNEAMKAKNKGQESILKIGHPSGTITIDVEAHKDDNGWILDKAAINRTARRIMDGFCYTPAGE
ncbi:methylitaconate delta2-delta3-isomerase [Dethiosulfatibacter aminovorans DSM 17477]|uniref:Methylitaconate delta2-delta3-isomerase n=1 Tax=Dethiosulfatibacter aminovorans DSM 17477 TaxID=1121476 RepID=A0A1M6A8C0_9FIRM|nr:PrpF domain-containing protein [Dethiosulfatibacter aminovorans]SHI32383.1 methylitaconate delta2-delta3-isomerase [Dethiosulfatibacter aminovorans DSM 17477]